MNQTRTTAYFPGLDELRFLAALGIVVLHVEEFKGLHRYRNWGTEAAPLAMMVTFFFVLSGFLITYLLLAERQATGSVAVGRFYVRRALRIWPVYYVVVFSGLLLLPHVAPLALPGLTETATSHVGAKLVLFLAFLPNVALVAFHAVPYAAHAWSIGVEEQFYLTWPLLVRFAHRLLPSMVGVIFAAGAARVVADMAWPGGSVALLLAVTRFGCMAIGGVGAYVLFLQEQSVLAVIYHRVTQLAVAGVLGWLVMGRESIPHVAFEVHSLLFCCIIMNVASNPATVFRVRSPVLALLGKWSYGVYMYHPLAIGLCVWILGSVFHVDLGGLLGSALIHGLTLALTIAAAGVSYRYFELPFLRLKRYAESAQLPIRRQANIRVGRGAASSRLPPLRKGGQGGRVA